MILLISSKLMPGSDDAAPTGSATLFTLDSGVGDSVQPQGTIFCITGGNIPSSESPASESIFESSSTWSIIVRSFPH